MLAAVGFTAFVCLGQAVRFNELQAVDAFATVNGSDDMASDLMVNVSSNATTDSIANATSNATVNASKQSVAAAEVEAFLGELAKEGKFRDPSCPELNFEGGEEPPKLAFVNIIRGQHLKVKKEELGFNFKVSGDLFSRSDPYVRFWIGSGDVGERSWNFVRTLTREDEALEWMAQTEYKSNTKEPWWNFGCVFSWDQASRLYIEVWDKDTFSKDDLLGQAVDNDEEEEGSGEVGFPINQVRRKERVKGRSRTYEWLQPLSLPKHGEDHEGEDWQIVYDNDGEVAVEVEFSFYKT